MQMPESTHPGQTRQQIDTPDQLASSSSMYQSSAFEQLPQSAAAVRHTHSANSKAQSACIQSPTDNAARQHRQGSNQHGTPLQHSVSREGSDEDPVHAHSLTQNYNSPVQRASSGVSIPGSAQLRQLTEDLADGASPVRNAANNSDPQPLSSSVDLLQPMHSHNRGATLGTNGNCVSPIMASADGKGNQQLAADQPTATATGSGLTFDDGTQSKGQNAGRAEIVADVAADSNTAIANTARAGFEDQETPVAGISGHPGSTSTASATSSLPYASGPHRAATTTANRLAHDNHSQNLFTAQLATGMSPTSTAPSVSRHNSGRTPSKKPAKASGAPKLHDAVRARLTGSAPSSPAQLKAAVLHALSTASPSRLSSGTSPGKQQAAAVSAPKLHAAVRAKLVGSAPSSPAYANRPKHSSSHAHAVQAASARTSQPVPAHALRQTANSHVGQNQVSAGPADWPCQDRRASVGEQNTGEARVSSAELPSHQGSVPASAQVLDLWQELRAANHDLQRGMHVTYCLVQAQGASACRH